MPQMACASDIKPHLHNNEDTWEKIHHFTEFSGETPYSMSLWGIKYTLNTEDIL